MTSPSRSWLRFSFRSSIVYCLSLCPRHVLLRARACSPPRNPLARQPHLSGTSQLHSPQPAVTMLSSPAPSTWLAKPVHCFFMRDGPRMAAETETALETVPPRHLTVKEHLLSTLVQAPLFFSATAVFGTVSLLASLTETDGRRQHRIARAWARFSLAVARSPIHISGLDVVHNHPVAVYACNHLSYMDTPAVFAAMPFQFRILARSDLWKLPFIGWHLNRSGQIAVNVDNPRASIASLTNGVRALKSGMPLFVFPEGGRSRDGRLGPFMSGPAW